MLVTQTLTEFAFPIPSMLLFAVFYLAQCPKMSTCLKEYFLKCGGKLPSVECKWLLKRKFFFIRMKSVFLTPTVNPIESLLNVIDMMKKRSRTLNASMNPVWLAAVVVVIVVLKFGCMFPVIIKLRMALIKRSKLWISLLYTEHMVRVQFSSCCKAISSIFLFLLFIFSWLEEKAGSLKKKMSYLFRMLNEFDAECLVNHVRESLTNKKSVKSSNEIHSLPPNSPTHTISLKSKNDTRSEEKKVASTQPARNNNNVTGCGTYAEAFPNL